MLMLSWAPVTTAAGAGLRGAAEAGVVRAAAPNEPMRRYFVVLFMMVD